MRVIIIFVLVSGNTCLWYTIVWQRRPAQAEMLLQAGRMIWEKKDKITSEKKIEKNGLSSCWLLSIIVDLGKVIKKMGRRETKEKDEITLKRQKEIIN